MAEQHAGPPSPKRQKLDVQAEADVVYDPSNLCDFLIRTADGKKLAVHRAFILRYSTFFGKLLDATPAETVPVTEPAEEFQSHFLDILYDRDKELRPENVLRVLDLADKYESPSLIRACRSTLCSEDFKLTIRRPGAVAGTLASSFSGQQPVHFESEEGHCSVLDALALASKYGFDDLFAKCKKFVSQASGKLMLYLSTSFCKDKLSELKPDHLVHLLQAIAGAHYEQQDVLAKQNAALDKEKMLWEAERAELKLAGEADKLQYGKLLRKYNQLIAKARQHGVTPNT